MTVTTEAPRNGVDVATLFATLDAVKGQNEIAKFQFRASNTWVTGTHSRSRSPASTAPCRRWSTSTRPCVDSDHPEVLVGADNAPDAGRVPAARASPPASPPASPTSPPPGASS